MESVFIIGAGVSGLVAAIELEKAGVKPVILERSDRIGGRLKTDDKDGYILDHGFQVLLTEYPAAKRYLDFSALDLKRFLPGAVVFKNKKAHTIGDPLRHMSFCWATAFSSIATLGDKWKVLQLANSLKSKTIASIFNEAETTTLDYLQQYGFSQKIIDNFFRPFYSGIFLEPNLQTSSRMFCFVFKMFSEGHAAVPAVGIQAISEQLQAQLELTEIRLNTTVEKVEDGKITLAGGNTLDSDCTIIATDPTSMLSGYKQRAVEWHSCYNLYFEVPKSTLKQPIIGLVAEADALINNLHFPTDLVSMDEWVLLSVTVVKAHDLDEKALAKRIEQELAQYCNISYASFLKMYPIQRALPVLSDLQYAPDARSIRYSDQILLAGDYLANASLNAAMEAGRLAAAEATRMSVKV